ncbi:glycosyltransferase [Candidatus Roizmanbacteria bacterium]|nr:glycosyltransferase [Candidatus Roizmanbacteria bacterium]
MINRKIRKWVDLENLKSSLIILANSNFSKEFIEKSYGIKARVCYLGVDANFFKPLNINKSIDILFIGNKDESYELLKESLKFFPTKPKIYTIFRENGKTTVSDKKLAVIYNKSKVLVTLNRNEPFGLIPLEAMACGIPVVAIREGGYTESVIDGKTGYLLPRDAYLLKKCLLFLLSDSQQQKKLGDQGRREALKNWTWEKSVERLRHLLEESKDFKNE